MVSLPLFQRAEAEAWSKDLEGIRVSPTEYATKSAANWKLKSGGDTIVIGFSQEPASMFSLVEQAAVQRQVADLGIGVLDTQWDYDFQPALHNPLSTIENGLAKNEVIEVKAGDTVYNTSGKPVKLEQGVKLFDADGKEVEYTGSGTVKMKQLTVTYKLNDYTWSDGTPGSVDDIKLAFQIECDKESGATEFITCDAIAKKEFGPGLQAVVTYVPGYQAPLYFIWPLQQIYPAHLVLKDGRKLADVPAKEWATLPEIAEKPLSYGPFAISEWKKGEYIKLIANPYFKPAPGVKNITIVIVQDTNQAVAQLLSGDLDYLEKATLGGGPEVTTLVGAAKEGKVNVEIIASPTWEHIDFNMFTK
jgi:ABC-type transport system substrate-binding protein